MTRPLTAEHVAFLKGVDSATLSNAIERFGVRPRTSGFIGGEARCAFPELGSMVGRALTITYHNPEGPGPDRTKWWEMWETLQAMEGPTVLVFHDASGDAGRVAYAGEIMVKLAQRLGSVGMITDGAMRDVAEARAAGFHYFMQYAVVSHANAEVLNVGDPVTIFGETIRTGDLLHGDVNGIVTVPWEILDALPESVETVRRLEKQDFDLFASDRFSIDYYKDHRGYR